MTPGVSIMISEHERRFFENINLPLVLCRYRDGRLVPEAAACGLCAALNAEREALMEAFRKDIMADVHPDDLVWLREAVESFVREHTYLDVIFRNRSSEKDDYMLLHTVGKWQTMEDGSEMILFGFNDMRHTHSGIADLFTELDRNGHDLFYTDAVTGLPNLNFLRQFAEEKLQDMRLCEKTPVLLYFDVKSMHSYNTHYGYEKGDELIALIGNTLREHFPDTFIGRCEDDHFVILDEFTSEERIREQISEADKEIRRTAFGNTDGICAGVCVIAPELKAAQAFDFARQALKDIGADMNICCSFYSMEKDDRYWRERYIIENFETALKNRWIKVYYQPILRTKSEKITILEALARWIDPCRGMISPAEFIPVLSHYHMLYLLDLYMVESVCMEFGLREETGLPTIPVSVNFSAQDFDYVDVPEKIKEILGRYGVDPGKIIVEITEQDIAKGTDHFKKQLRQIRANGHRLWIDDFGSEYSSLKVFSLYDIDRIKFDMDLIRHLDENNGANRRIMKAIVNVCREIGVHTLAEGVETEAQLEFLREIDCDMVQGYYFFKPDPLDVSVFKFRHRGTPIPHETNEERLSSYNAWLKK